MRINITFWAFVLLNCLGYGMTMAQRTNITDSLEVKQILVDDDKRLEILNRLGSLYLRNQPDKAIDKAGEAIELSNKLDKPASRAEALRIMALGYQYRIADADTAIHLCYTALEIDEALNNEEGKIATFLTMSDVYQDMGNHFKSLDFLSKAELIATKLNAQHKLAEILLEKGKAFIEIDHIPEALEVYKKVLKMAKLHDLTGILGECHIALGNYYHQFGDFRIAKEHFDEALAIFQKLPDHYALAEAYFLQGVWQLDQDSIDKALSYFNQSLKLRQHVDDVTGIAECYLQLGKTYLASKDDKNALLYLNKGLQLASKKNNKRLLRKCYDHLYHAHTSAGNLEKATEFRDKYSAISELIYTEESERELAELITKIELDKKEQELAFERERLDNKEAQLQKEHKLNIALIIISILVLAGAGYAFYNYREKQQMNDKLKQINQKVMRQNDQLKELNATKDKFFSIIGHDLKGPLNSLSSFSNLLINYTDSLSKEEIKSTAMELEKTLKNVSGLLNNLLTWARTQTGKIELDPKPIELTQLVKQNFSLLEHSAENKNIALQLNAEGQIKAYADENTINTVLRNLISNAIKYTHDHGKISVNVNEWKDAVEVAVKDNGVGMNEATINRLFKIGEKISTKGTKEEKGTGLGLIICKEFVEQNGGEIYVDSKIGEGSTFHFTLPKAADRKPGETTNKEGSVAASTTSQV